jgi:hypothetical protein
VLAGGLTGAEVHIVADHRGQGAAKTVKSRASSGTGCATTAGQATSQGEAPLSRRRRSAYGSRGGAFGGHWPRSSSCVNVHGQASGGSLMSGGEPASWGLLVRGVISSHSAECPTQ